VSLERLRFPDLPARGRRYPEPPHPYRTEYQRDRDRVVHARAFRRLEDKTQVFGARLYDHFRNRLTHTIEVSQIARTVAAALHLNQDYTEALALAHDIGHPPFAHAGEQELNRQMQAFGERFDHNLHALHIVESFELRYARFPGLNLTFEVREGMVKHSRDFAPGEDPALDEYLPGMKPALEAQIIDLADECAYNTADLDDGFSAGLFSLEEIAAHVPYYGDMLASARNAFPDASEEIWFQEVLRRLIDLLVSGLIEGTAEAARGFGSIDEVRTHPRRLARMKEESEKANRALKQFLHQHVYSSPGLVEERRIASASVSRLFHYFLDRPEAMPESQRSRLSKSPLHRIVCDYIAGMTDGYLRRTEAQLFGSSA